MELPIAWSFLGFQDFEIWIVIIGALACSSAGLIGCFLILRRMALMGDAISHAVLPGIVIAVMITGEISSWPVLFGAGLVGVLTPYLVDSLKSTGRVYEDASIGIVFTMLFSLGVILIANMGNVHLDVECVLYGEIATAPFDTWILASGQKLGPRAVWILGGVFLLNVAFIVLFFKELKVCTFDPGLAEAMGLHPKRIHYMLLGMVALTTVAAFESVGSIIVVAMLIAPGAAAYLLTDRLGVMLLLSVGVGVLCSVLGFTMASQMGGKISIAGSMATVAGLLFGVAFLFSPRYGVLVRFWRRFRLRRRLIREHILGDLYRALEKGQDWLSENTLFGQREDDAGLQRKVANKLLHKGMILWESGKLRLTPSGQAEAGSLVRAHRLWELYLEQNLGIPADHVHRSADDIEHFLSPEIQAEIEKKLQYPDTDPHGKPIPKMMSRDES